MSVLGIRRVSVTATAWVAGIASAAACGCGIDLIKALASLAFALLAQALLDARLAGTGRGVSTRRARRVAWALYFSVGLLLSVRSGGGLVLIGLLGAGVIGAAGVSAKDSSGRASIAAPALRAGLLGIGAWLVMVGVNYVQRQSFFVIPLVSAVSLAAMVAAAEWTEAVLGADAGAPQPSQQRLRARWGVAAWVLFAHAWLALAVWWLIPPVATLAACAALPLGLLVAWRLGRADACGPTTAILAAFAALAHGVGLALGFGWVVWLR